MSEPEITPVADAVAEAMPDLPEMSDEEWAARDERIKEAQQEERRKEKETRWLVAQADMIERGMSKLILATLFGDPGKHKQTPALEAIKRLPDREGSIWCLSGNVGCGKTFAAHRWLVGEERELVDTRGARMVTSAWFARSSRYEGTKFNLCGHVPYLVFDDLGAEYADTKDSFLADLDELIDMRWRRGLQTLITTNLVKDQFKRRYGNRIIDRIRQYGGWLEVKHPSLRGEKC